MGNLYQPLGDTRLVWANAFSSALLVSGWGYFLYMGVIDPMGGINTLWPLFGIANQLLAVIAFCLGTSVLIKMGRQRYLPVTVIPLVFLISVTFSAGYIKIFSPDPTMGFLAGANFYAEKLAAGGTAAEVATWNKVMLMNQVDALVAGFFLICVAVIVVGCLNDWVRMLAGSRRPVLHEAPYVPFPDVG
jgi:carbon starvation protein